MGGTETSVVWGCSDEHSEEKILSMKTAWEWRKKEASSRSPCYTVLDRQLGAVVGVLLVYRPPPCPPVVAGQEEEDKEDQKKVGNEGFVFIGQVGLDKGQQDKHQGKHQVGDPLEQRDEEFVEKLLLGENSSLSRCLVALLGGEGVKAFSAEWASRKERGAGLSDPPAQVAGGAPLLSAVSAPLKAFESLVELFKTEHAL